MKFEAGQTVRLKDDPTILEINDKLESIDSRIDEINERIGRSTILGRLGVK